MTEIPVEGDRLRPLCYRRSRLQTELVNIRDEYRSALNEWGPHQQYKDRTAALRSELSAVEDAIEDTLVHANNLSLPLESEVID